MWYTILGAILGFVGSVVAAAIFEWYKQPKFEMQVVPPEDMQFDNSHPAKHFRSIKIKLTSKKPLFSYIPRNPALECHGEISFYHLDGQNIFGRSMVLRWPDVLEPLPTNFMFNIAPKPGTEGKSGTGKILDQDRMKICQRRNIYAGETTPIDIAAKFDNEPECYGWNNQSYHSAPPWRNPDWKIASGRFLVKVNVWGSGIKVSKIFRLVNDVGQKDFRLEDARPGDLEKV